MDRFCASSRRRSRIGKAVFKDGTPRRRCGILYDSCYDMLSTLMLWTLTDPSTATQQLSEGSEPKFRWPYYSIIIKKLKKEIADQRVPPELRALLQFLPIPKNTISVFAMEPYGTPSVATVQKLSGGAARPPSVLQSAPMSGVRHGRYALHISEKVKTSSYDFIHAYINEQNTKGGWKWGWFQASKIDRLPCPIQKWVTRILVHKHQLEYQRPNSIITESNDHFLSAPAVEATGDAPAPSASSANTPGTQTPATPTVSVMGVEATTPGNEEVITSLNSAVSTPSTSDVTMDDATPEQNRTLSSASNPVSPRTTRGGRKRANVNRQHIAGSRQKRSASRNEPPAPSITPSFAQPWHGTGPNVASSVLSQQDPVTYSQHQAQQLSSNAVKDPTKTKIQECINKKRLEAARISAGFPDSNFSHHSGNNRPLSGDFQNQHAAQANFVQSTVLLQASQSSVDPSQQQMPQQQQMQAIQPSHHTPASHQQQQPAQQSSANQQMPPQQQPPHIASQGMQHSQVSQQPMMEQQMGQSHLQQTRSSNIQGAMDSQQFPQISGSAHHQSSLGGQMNFQGHTGQLPQQAQQQPRNTMGQFTSREGTMNIDYQQGGRGSRQSMQLSQQTGSQGGIGRSSIPSSQMSGHMGSQHISDTQQVGGHTIGSQQMSHQMTQASMSGQHYFIQQDQRTMNPPYNQSQYTSNNQF
ncbi:hypothetical protein RB195_025006 [Necator americanus]|uniref:Uncharacterized protein n=1 Tax=Necator americanus TaxID=51031 RepID=A0ABR1EQH0_NECAM